MPQDNFSLSQTKLLATSIRCNAMTSGVYWFFLSLALLQGVVFYYLNINTDVTLYSVTNSYFGISLLLNSTAFITSLIYKDNIAYLRAYAIGFTIASCFLALEVYSRWGATESAAKLITICFILLMITFYADIPTLLITESLMLITYAMFLFDDASRPNSEIIISVLKHPFILLFFLFTIRKMLMLNQAEILQKSTANLQLEYLSTIDYLTKLTNRKGYNTSLNALVDKAKHSHSSFTLLILDIDYFKNYNDALGHPAGDQCLLQVAGILTSVLKRKSDIVARIGGEEFAIILPNSTAKDAEIICQRIHSELAEQKIDHPNSAVASYVTLSIGIAEFDNDDIDSIYVKADKALYQAKHDGRNGFITYQPEVYVN